MGTSYNMDLLSVSTNICGGRPQVKSHLPVSRRCCNCRWCLQAFDCVRATCWRAARGKPVRDTHCNWDMSTAQTASKRVATAFKSS